MLAVDDNGLPLMSPVLCINSCLWTIWFHPILTPWWLLLPSCYPMGRSQYLRTRYKLKQTHNSIFSSHKVPKRVMSLSAPSPLGTTGWSAWNAACCSGGH
jgi:hypothetical protein